MSIVSGKSLAALLPHAGYMCLLDTVRTWTENAIECTATSHVRRDNPLRDEHGLPAVCAIEYAAQAMALHCGLSKKDQCPPVRGYLGSLHDISLAATRLDDIPGPLVVTAVRLFGAGHAVSYKFCVSALNRTLLSGRAGVFLERVEEAE